MARILVADDDGSVLEMIKDALLMSGYEVDTAADGAMVLAMIRKKPYDLLLLDRNMPKMDGLQTLQLIRGNSDPKLRAMKVIMCTAASVTREIDEAFAAGATDYLLKPIMLQMMFGKVQKALGK